MKKSLKIVLIILSVVVICICLGIVAYFAYQKKMEGTIDNSTFTLKDNINIEVYSDSKVSDFIETIDGVIIEDKIIDTKELGEQEISFLYKNNKKRKRTGTFKINVVDTTPPFIMVKGAYTVQVGFNKNLSDVILSADNYDSNPRREIIGEYNLNTLGVYPLEYKVTDKSGNVSTEKFNLNVVKKSSSSTKTYTYFKDIVNEHKSENTRIGIDVSKWQGDIDFEKLKENGVEFVIIRIGTQNGFDGENLEDVYFKNNIEKAKEAGLDVGLYFYSYAKTKEEAIEQAKWVVEKLDGMELELPIAFDWETWTGFNTIGLSLYEFNEMAEAFMQAIEKEGYDSMLYGSKNYLVSIYSTKRSVWLAHYTSKTNYEGDYYIWQMCNDGIVDGINGYVDIDILYEK